MNLKPYFNAAKKFTIDNSPAIFAGMGIAGSVGTALLAFKAGRRFEDAKMNSEIWGDDVSTSKKLIFQNTWRIYVPTFISLVGTVGCIFAATQIGQRRNAALVTAYSLSEKAFVDYRDKVVELLGEKEHRKIVDAVAEDHIRDNPTSNGQVFITNKGGVMCYESYTGRYFNSDYETLRKTQNDLNATILSDDYASLNDFFRLLNLPPVDIGEEVGWTSDKLLELQFSSILDEQNNPCLHIGYLVLPIRNYYKFG